MSTMPTLFTKNERLAALIASDWNIPGLGDDDVRQEARIALWIACRQWQPEKGSFKLFAGVVIRRRMFTLLNVALNSKNRSLNESIRVCVLKEGEVSICDTLAGGEDPLEVVVRQETLDQIVAAARRLTKIERRGFLTIVNGDPYHANGKTDGSVDGGAYRARIKMREAVA